MTELGLRKVVALLDGLPDPLAAALRHSFRPPMRQAISAERGCAIVLPAEQRNSAVTDFLLAMATSPSDPSPGLSGLACAAASHITSALVEEHPQTIAVVLTRPPAAAAEVLELLPTELRNLVARRIAMIEAVDELTIHTVESLLVERLAALPQPRLATIDGVAALGEILQSLDRSTEHAFF